MQGNHCKDTRTDSCSCCPSFPSEALPLLPPPRKNTSRGAFPMNTDRIRPFTICAVSTSQTCSSFSRSCNGTRSGAVSF